MARGEPLMATPAAIIACGRYVIDQWGEDGYHMKQISSLNVPSGAALFEVTHSDGSVFFVAADRHGGCEVDDEQVHQCVTQLRQAVAA
jgi:hypothetical protein